jgi:signal transduction histidine kinase
MPTHPIATRCWIVGIISVLMQMDALAVAEGNPLTRAYSFEEIGCSADGIQLGHDPFGRIAVAQGGDITVLNDTVWKKVWSSCATTTNLGRITSSSDGTLYFGALGSWGTFRTAEGGSLQPRILTPEDAPEWVRATNFDQILTTASGVVFSGIHGAVYRDLASGTQTFFRIPGLSSVFLYNGAVLASTHDHGFVALDPLSGRTVPTSLESLQQKIVVAAAGDGRQDLLVATAMHRLYILKAGVLEPVKFGSSIDLPGRVTALVRTPEGTYAAAIADWGVLILDGDGRIKNTCNGYEYANISALECHEQGVLWAATGGGVLRIFYGQPVTTFDRSLGLPIEWPQIVSWQGTPIIASGGHIYEPAVGTELEQSRFRRVANEPPTGGWGIAVVGESLLVGNGHGVFCANGVGFVRIASSPRVARLVAIDENTCFLVGAEEIGVLRFQNGIWAEAAPRIPGVGYPYIVHAGHGTAWVELGQNRVARIGLIDGRLSLRLFEEFPWTRPTWVNVSVVGTTIVLCGDGRTPVFLDDRTLEKSDEPLLRQLFAESPYCIQRIHRDRDGSLLVSHARGLYSVQIHDGRYESNLTSYAGVNGPTPRVFSPPGSGVWASTGNTLYRLQNASQLVWPQDCRPRFISMRDSRTNALLSLEDQTAGSLGAIRYSQNSIQFDLFAGSYAFVRPFSYEYRLNDGHWRQSATASSLFIPDLHEGDYHLSVRIVDGQGLVGRSEDFGFTILPPWYRCWYAWATYPLLTLGLVWSIFRLSMLRAHKRQAALEQEVAERTDELRTTMGRLQQEALNSAILTERNRLAAEIHDSIEQGFAGLALQIESTADLTGCPGKVRTGLVAALNMIAFCRTEIRHAIRGLHSSALGSADLGSALRQIVSQLAPIPDYATIRIEGTPQRIDSATEHHLLRIAQEAVANSLKHASAKHLEILLRYDPAEIRLSVSDDGRGFSPEDTFSGKDGHLGLRSLRSRASKIGGEIRIHSRLGGGTSIVVTVAPAGSPATKV